jgi:hypothetical protein
VRFMLYAVPQLLWNPPLSKKLFWTGQCLTVKWEIWTGK